VIAAEDVIAMDKKTKRDTDRHNESLSPVDPDRLYPLEVFHEITGLGRAAMRSARDSGLAVHYVGGRGWVLGSDWIEHVMTRGKLSNEN
jgi:hypothetical protein